MNNPYTEQVIRKGLSQPPAPDKQNVSAAKPQFVSTTSSPRTDGLSGSAVNLVSHVRDLIELIDKLVSISISYQDFSFQNLSREARELRRLIYTLATHFGKLAKQSGTEIGAGSVRLVKESLAKVGIPDWSPTERVAWCQGCGYDPVYSLRDADCDTCGWMLCPQCGKCKRECPGRKSHQTSAEQITVSDITAGEEQADVPF